MSSSGTGSGALSTLAITQKASPGILLSLALFAQPDLEQNFQTFASIGINNDQDRPRASRIVELARGYISEEDSLTWTGFYPLKPGDFIYAFIRGNTDTTFELVDRRLTKHINVLPGVTLEDLLRTTS